MRTALNLVVAVLLLVALVAVGWLVCQRPPPEPVYQQQPLSYWLAAYDSGNYKLAHPNGPAPPTRTQSDAAIRAMGTNALPTLLRMIQEPISGPREKVFRLLQKYHVIKAGYLPDGRHNFAAYGGFTALGPTVSNALPQLIMIFDHNHSAFVQMAVPVIIAQAGPAGRPAIPSLLRGAVHTNFLVRYDSIYALGCIHAEPEIVVPVLIKALNDSVPMVRKQSASALGKYGTNAVSAVPALLALYHREKPVVATNAAVQLMGTSTVVSRDWSSAAALAGLQPNVLGASWDALEAIDPAVGTAAASEK